MRCAGYWSRIAQVLRRCRPPAPAATAPRGNNGSGNGGSGNGGGRGGDQGRQRAAPAPLPNGLAVQVVYRSDSAEGAIRLGDAWRVKPTDDLIAALHGEFAGSSIEIVY